ncbi:MAG: UPF0182 family protein, partial [Acidimicrobiia bacterium]|nr:UPF0182 family protein [Acidimicrobiia bacterium]
DNYTRYKGKDGVRLSSFVRKAAFALKFGQLDPLISGQVTNDSKILFNRDIKARVEKLAPFLQFDADPYPVIVGGKTTWILDGYTTSDQYPYGQSFSGSGGLAGDYNYARNSVKATVDAYEGTVKFYVIDPSDPIIQSYQEAFPDLFSKFGEMPDALRAHLRFPEDLFKLQSGVFATYHVTEPRRFYSGNERWLLSPDPSAVVGSIPAAAADNSNRGSGRSPQITAQTQRQDPYYLFIRLPGDDRESFLILQPFVPVSKDNQQTRLVSFMTAKSDPRDYGKMEAFVMPQGQQVLGPVQVAANINKDTAISREITLLDQRGSRVISGNVQLIPVGDSIVYVQPIFTIAAQGPNPFPQFQFVTVLVQGKAPVKAATVNEALLKLFGAPGATPDSTATPTTPTTPTDQTVTQLLDQAAAKFNAADDALRSGDLGTYQRLVKEARDLVAQAQAQLSGGEQTPSPTTTSTTTSTTKPASSALQASKR